MKKKYFSPIYFAATWCQEKKKLKNISTIKKKNLPSKFFFSFYSKNKNEFSCPKK